MTSNKRRRHTPDQIIRKLVEGNKLLASGQELDEVCRHLEVAESTWHRWLAQYGGMKANDAKRLKELEAENARLKKLVANQALDIDMAWSYDLLDDAEKSLLTRCAVFAGGFDLEGACTVAGFDDVDDFAILDLLDALVRKSLLVADGSAGRTRFSMLETIRQFAEEQLVARGAATEVRATHTRHFAGREADIMALWDSPRQREAYDWFTAEFANLRTAFRWAADHGDLDVAATIATYAGLLGFCVESYEPMAWAEELSEPARAVDHPRLAFLYVIASLCCLAGRVEAALRYSEAGQAVITAGGHEVPFGAEGLLGGTYMLDGQPERWAELCNALLQRRCAAPVNIRACLVFALAFAGSVRRR
jgi:hypothetical protein